MAMMGKRVVRGVSRIISSIPGKAKTFGKHGAIAVGVGMVGLPVFAKKVKDWAVKPLEQAGILNPLWLGRRVHQGYGKRGIDANSQAADGLVQSLHRNRRSQR